MEETKRSLSWKIVDSIIILQILHFLPTKNAILVSVSKLQKIFDFLLHFIAFVTNQNLTHKPLHETSHEM